jgi:DNA-directed RNA polymerase II subunit RPB1
LLTCSCLRVCKSDPSFADKIRHVRDPKARMAVVWGHCKGKMICDPDDPKEEGDDSDEKKGHGGCGHVQPQIRKEGLKLFVHYKKSKDDDDVRQTFLFLNSKINE